MKKNIKKGLKLTKKVIHIKLIMIMILLVPFIVFTLLTSKTDRIFGIQSFVVLTGSMNPAIAQGSVIFTSKHTEYIKNEVIAFHQGNITVTHRIIEVVKKEGNIFYKTQGDANTSADLDLVPINTVIGKAENSIPFVGNFVLFMRTLPGFVLFIVTPTLLFIVFELWSIKGEIEKSTERRILAKIGGIQQV